MARILTVNDLIDDVRSMIDEENQDAVDDTSDILPSLNRAQDFAADIIARRYEEPLLTKETLTLSGSQSEYNIPEAAYQDRLEKVEILIGQDAYEVLRLDFRQISDYETSISVNTPRYYTVVGRKFRLVPKPTGTYNARIWYLREPDKLVKSQGRITNVDIASDFITVDAAGGDLTTESDNLGSYVNIVDGQTGIVKISRQIKRIVGSRIYFKSSPDRTTVLNRTIDTDFTSIPDPSDSTQTVTVNSDDYICNIEGTAVPFLRSPVTNFMIQYATAEMTRKLGGPASTEEQILQKFEDQVQKTWVGREQQLRVKKRSKNWDRTRRRWPFSGGNQ